MEKLKNVEEFFHSELEWDATIRELELIGEATNNLLKFNAIDAKYRRLVDFKNQIIHGYFGIDEEIVWDVVKNKLTIYINELKTIIKDNNIDLTAAIMSAAKEKKHNENVLKFLEYLRKENQ